MAKPASTKAADESNANVPVAEPARDTGPEVAGASAAAVAEAKSRREAFMKRVKVTKNVTLPLFKMRAGDTIFCRIEGAIFIGKEIKENSTSTKKKEPAHLMNVTDLETGELGQIIVATVLRGILTEEYPDDAYVGKSFEIKQRKISGKDYNGFDVTEIEIA